MPELLEVRNISAGYGPLQGLHEIEITVREGERIGPVVPNGHGKTTLIRALTHMTGWRQGSMRLDGKDIGGTRSMGAGRRTPGLIRRGIGVAPRGDATGSPASSTSSQHSDRCSTRSWASFRAANGAWSPSGGCRWRRPGSTSCANLAAAVPNPWPVTKRSTKA